MEHAPDQRLYRFFKKAVAIESIGLPEIAVYAVLFELWVKAGYCNPVVISRSQVMRLSKVKSKTTYHKCISILSGCGYIEYFPSYHPKGSSIFLSEIE